MRRSFKLIVDTHKLGDSSATGMQAVALDSTFSNKNLPNIYGAESVPTSSGESDSRMRILKDSSKDFLTPYNPNVNTKTASSTSSSTPTSTSSSSASSSSTTRSTNKLQSLNVAENEIHYSRNVEHTKLIGLPPASETNSFLNQTMLFAVLGSTVLFLAIFVLYLLMRPTRKHISVMDKQVLIQTEVLPSQLPLNPASVHQSSSTDQRTTLHV